jgi:hypothetical protein
MGKERIEGVLFPPKAANLIITNPGFAVGGTLKNTSKW